MKSKKILVFSAHPDDAETGAGGFCIRAVQNRHDVTVVHICCERRNKKIKGVFEGKVRRAEAKKAAGILGVKVEFMDYYIGECSATIETTNVFEDFIRKRKPHLVLTQWPIDTHPDHQVAGIVPLRPFVWHRKFDLGFYEVFAGIQTISFTPNRFVDISGAIDRKKRAVFAHESQNPKRQWAIHKKMAEVRGLESGCKYAEAFHIPGDTSVFDKLFNEERIYGPSGGMERYDFPRW